MSILGQVDLSPALTPGDYAEQLARYQSAWTQLVRQVEVQRRPAIILFEGWEAAGQGDAIKRLTETLDPRGYVVYVNTPPEGDDKTHHYLYRFWRRLPARGDIAILDGSWYERVLAGRVEPLCTRAEWQRAYREIDQFERQLVDFGTIIVKFWLHISPDEQLRRLNSVQEDRASDQARPAFLIEDQRGRLQRDLHEAAVEEMLLKTSTLSAPWTIVAANDAPWAQIKVLRTVTEAFSQELGYVPESPNAKQDEVTAQETQKRVKPGREANNKKVRRS
jgi:polyphosphate kinase 2 (PPK2 family)